MKNQSQTKYSQQSRGSEPPWTVKLRALLVLGGWCLLLPTALAQGTAFTYQGRLDEPSGPANGTYDFTFRLYDAVSGGSSQGGPLTNSAVTVSDGYFTVTLDFGLNPFSSGAARWVEIAVRTNGGSAFGMLTPRQALTPAPYAIYSGNVSGAGISGTINSASIANGSIGANQLANASVTSAKLADGAALAELLDDDGAGSGLDADLLDGLQASAFWQLGGNNVSAGQFLGSTNSQPLEFKVGGLRALRLEDNGDSASDPGTTPDGAPNVIGGSPHNFVAAGVVGAFIGGGGATNSFGLPYTNSVLADFGVVGGGAGNVSSGSYSTVGGGFRNTSSGSRATVSGGVSNTGSGGLATVSGGISNTGSGESATVGGGGGNISSGIYATVPGGLLNVAQGDYSFAAGSSAKANHSGAFVWSDSQNADFASTSSNQFLIRASGGVGIGETAPKAPLHVTEGSSSTTAVTANAIAVFERSSHAYVMVVTPTNRESGILFGSPTDDSDGGVLFNGNTPRGLEFRTGGNNVKMVIESGGDIGIGTTNPVERLHVVGNILATGTITPNSDRNAKTDLAPTDCAAILQRVVALPIQHWRFKSEAPGVQHVGPMAQDFHAAFGLGAHETAITTVDADGVALAAIQGLNHKVEDKAQKSEVRIQKLEAENAELRVRLEKLETLLARQK